MRDDPSGVAADARKRSRALSSPNPVLHALIDCWLAARRKRIFGGSAARSMLHRTARCMTVAALPPPPLKVHRLDSLAPSSGKRFCAQARTQ